MSSWATKAVDDIDRETYAEVPGLLRAARREGDAMKCNRCQADGADEPCWWCSEYLCVPCWEALGHCGHAEAENENEKQRAKETGK